MRIFHQNITIDSATYEEGSRTYQTRRISTEQSTRYWYPFWALFFQGKIPNRWTRKKGENMIEMFHTKDGGKIKGIGKKNEKMCATVVKQKVVWEVGNSISREEEN
jgi:hypothetical protein